MLVKVSEVLRGLFLLSTGESMRRFNTLTSTALTWNNAPDILTVEEAALLARVPRNGMYEAVRLGLVPSMNFGRRRTRIAKAALAKVFALNVEMPHQTAVFNPSET
jgi:hypothetical protein